MHLLEVAQEFIDHFFLCPHRDAMNDRDEVHPTINDLLSPLPTESRKASVTTRLRVAPPLTGRSAAARSRYCRKIFGCISTKRLLGSSRVSIWLNFSNSRSTLLRLTRPGSVLRTLKGVLCQSELSSAS